MILVGQYDSPFVRRVAVTLHHYHMPFERNTISVYSQAKKMQKINPLIRIPSLELASGEILIDSWAILDYLDELAGPARALMPSHGPERRKIMQTVALAVGAAEKAGAINREHYFHPGKMLSKEYEERCLYQLQSGLTELEKNCGSPWYSDLHMSQADVTIGCLIGYLKLRVPAAFPAKKFPKLHGLSLHCEMREEFVKSRISADEVMPARK
jgi:glutathione S-transferase